MEQFSWTRDWEETESECSVLDGLNLSGLQSFSHVLEDASDGSSSEVTGRDAAEGYGLHRQQLCAGEGVRSERIPVDFPWTLDADENSLVEFADGVLSNEDTRCTYSPLDIKKGLNPGFAYGEERTKYWQKEADNVILTSSVKRRKKNTVQNITGIRHEEKCVQAGCQNVCKHTAKSSNENEDELVKIRRLKNRASVQKCRRRRKNKLIALENEHRVLTQVNSALRYGSKHAQLVLDFVNGQLLAGSSVNSS